VLSIGASTESIHRRTIIERRARRPVCRLRARRLTGLIVLLLFTPVITTDVSAVDLPVRDILLRDFELIPLQEIESFNRYIIQFDSRYWDLYRLTDGPKSHDYHQSDFRLTGLFKHQSLLYGFEASGNSLTLEQDNVYTGADRMRGGRDETGGRLLFGFVSGRQGTGDSTLRTTLLGSAGWQDGFTASLDGMVRTDSSRVSTVEFTFGAKTFLTQLGIAEEILGYRFPFSFEFRTEKISSELGVSVKECQVKTWGSWQVSHGDDDPQFGFRNHIYHREAEVGGAVSYRSRFTNAGRTLLRKTQPDSRIPGFSLTIDHHSGNSFIKMYKDNIPYLRLKDLTITNTDIRLDVVPLVSTTVSLGRQRLKINNPEDAFFDIWPFTVWDLFLAKRYRIFNLDKTLDIWYLSLGTIYDWHQFRAELRGQWEWWNDSGGVDWGERVPILYPFFFKYEYYFNDWNLSKKYLIQLEPLLSCRIGERMSVTIEARMMVPLGTEKEQVPTTTPSPPPGPSEPAASKKEHGGLSGRISFIYSL